MVKPETKWFPMQCIALVNNISYIIQEIFGDTHKWNASYALAARKYWRGNNQTKKRQYYLCCCSVTWFGRHQKCIWRDSFHFFHVNNEMFAVGGSPFSLCGAKFVCTACWNVSFKKVHCISNGILKTNKT